MDLAKEFGFLPPADGIWPYERERKPRKACLEKQISHFLETAQTLPQTKYRNAEVKTPYFSLYLRSRRTRGLQLLDIARIEVVAEYRNKGVFSAIISGTKSLRHIYDGVRLEQIFNPLLLNWCEKNGWVTECRTEHCATYFKRFGE